MSTRVLVVDDIEANRRLMKAKLESRYHSVSLASSGREALDVARTQEPQIILLDVMMPGMDGYEVCRRLKAMPETRHIPVAMLTALTDAEDRVRGLEAGADDFLSKPINDEALFARIEALGRFGSVAAQLREQNARTASTDLLSPEEQARIEAPACIMVLDENIARAEQMAANLSGIGHEVVLWQDAEGQASLASQRLDLIVLALSGQPHDPLRLCANFKATGLTDKLSILVTYNQPDHERATMAMGLGASDMVRTPVNQQELIARIRTQLRRQRYVDILRKRIDRGLELSIVDQLTGLYNRRYMLNQLELWRKRVDKGGAPVSVVALDIDHFKAINDQHGHQAGDVVLEAFAERLRQNIRPKDIACRPGGEEFLVIMPETNAESAQMGAERIRKAIAEDAFLVEAEKLSLNVTVSAGVATFKDGIETVNGLLHRADQALYAAKQAGRNQVMSLAA